MRTGATSTFTGPNFNVDTFTEKKAPDLITSYDWNKLGDAIYNLEAKTQSLINQKKDYTLCPEIKIWFGQFSPVWDLAVANQLSATGQIIIPPSACVVLGTSNPTWKDNMVKVSVKQSLPANQRLSFGTNITSSFWCPANQNINASQSVGRAPLLTPELQRTIIVGLYFDGYPVPPDLNNYGLICSVFITAEG